MYRDCFKILGVLLIKPTQTSMSLPSRLQNCTSKKVLWVQESITISRNRWKGVFFLINCYHDQCMYQWQLLCDNIINANFMYQLYTIIWYFFSSHLEIKIRQTFCIRCYAAAKILLLHKWCHNLKVSNYCKLTISGMHFLSV